MKKILSYKKTIIFLIILVVAGLGYFFYQRENERLLVKSEKTYIVGVQNIRDELSISGNVDADEKVDLAFQTGGKLAWVGVKVGDKVKKYQGIASLDQRELEKRLKKDLNLFMTARWNFDQVKDDNRDSVIWSLTEDQRRRAFRQIDLAQFNLDNSIIDVEIRDLSKEVSYLYSPIEGIVTRVDTPYAGVNTTSLNHFEVINPDTIRFIALADQTDVVKMKEGMSADVSLDAYPDVKKKASISTISLTPKSGEVGTVYEMKMNFNESSEEAEMMRVGMTGDATFVLNEKDTLAIPTSIIILEGEKKYVYKKVNDRKEKTYIETGVSNDAFTEVTTGLKPGDIVYDKAR